MELPTLALALARLLPIAVALTSLTGCNEDHEPIPRVIPEIAAPPPVPAYARTPLPAPFRVRAADLHAVVGIGVDFDLPVVEAVVNLPGPDEPAPGEPDIHILSLRLERPDVVFPIDTIVTGLNFFIELLEPRLRIDRLDVVDGRLGTLAAPWQAPGRWLWRMRGIDLVARDIELGGRDAWPTEGLTIVRSSATGEIRGRPLELRGLALDVERTATEFIAEGTVRLPATLVDADFFANARNEWTTELAADTFALADLVAFIPQLEEAAPGGGFGTVVLAGGPDLQAVATDRLVVASGESRATARGELVTEGPGARFRDVRIDLEPVTAADLDRVFGAAPPGGGVWTGYIAGEGTFREGVRLSGELTQLRETGERSDFIVGGIAILEPEPYLDVAVRTDPLRAADTAFVASLDLVGPADSLSITGRATARGVPDLHATLDALLLDPPDAPPVVTGEAVVTAAPATVRRLAGLEPDDAGAAVTADTDADADTANDDPQRRTRRVPGPQARRAPKLLGRPAPTPLGRLAPTLPGRPAPTPPSRPAPTLLGRPAPTFPGRPAPGERERGGIPSHAERRPDPGEADLVARAAGSVVLDDDGPIDVLVTTDSLPLTLVPVPEAIDSVRGAATGRARIGGTVGDPAVSGRFTVRDGGFYVEPLSMPVDELIADLRLAGGLLIVDTLTAEAGGGDVAVTGTARLFDGPRRFDLGLHAERVKVKDDPEGDVRLSADLALHGPFERPALTGRVYDLYGWVRESAFQEDPLLDLDDPPYAELARRAPWVADSKLLARAEPEEPPPVDARVVVEVTPGFVVVDEDSELYGRGEVVIASAEDDFEVRGLVALEGGFYAFFGERFDVVGGAAQFEGDIEPYITLDAELEEDWPIGAGQIATARDVRRFPPLEFFAIGPAGRPEEQLYRWSLFPETQVQLAGLLIYDSPPRPVTGWRRDPAWRPSDPGHLFDERAGTQAAGLLWSYIADEAYDYIPLSRARIEAGTIRVGPSYPARVVVGPMIGLGTVFRQFEVFLTQALVGAFVPGVRVRASGFVPLGARVEAFSVPRFYLDTPLGEEHPGFFVRRKTGVGLFWEWEYGGDGGFSRPAPRGNPPPR